VFIISNTCSPRVFLPRYMQGNVNVPVLSWSVTSVGIPKSDLKMQKTSQVGLSSHKISFMSCVAVSPMALRTKNREFGIRHSANDRAELSICEVNRDCFRETVIASNLVLD